MKTSFSSILASIFILSVVFYSCQSSDFDQLYFKSNFRAWVDLDSGIVGNFQNVSDSQNFAIDTILKANRLNLSDVDKITTNKITISIASPATKPIALDSLIEIKVFAKNNEDTIRIAELDSVLKTNIVSGELVLNPTLQSIRGVIYPEDSLKLMLDARMKGGIKVKHQYLIKVEYTAQ
jgi:hypothetical protein